MAAHPVEPVSVEENGNPFILLWILLGGVGLVVIGGGCIWYMLKVKRKSTKAVNAIFELVDMT